MLVKFFKKTMFLDIKVKVAIYLVCLFGISALDAFAAIPKSYFSHKDNIFNVYFVKIGWLWTLGFTALFLIVTSYAFCDGDKKELLQKHFSRIGIATFFWYFWTKMFNVIEVYEGHCNVEGRLNSFPTKASCLKGGHIWNSLDISGHCFILIYSSLVLIEEARPIEKWEMMERYVLGELHNRTTSEESEFRLLKNLSQKQLEKLKHLNEVLTPLVYALFIGMAALQMLWDLMLMCTILYYHSLLEKLLGGVIAVHTWHFTYRFWYIYDLRPVLPGHGCFVY